MAAIDDICFKCFDIHSPNIPCPVSQLPKPRMEVRDGRIRSEREANEIAKQVMYATPLDAFVSGEGDVWMIVCSTENRERQFVYQGWASVEPYLKNSTTESPSRETESIRGLEPNGSQETKQPILKQETLF